MGQALQEKKKKEGQVSPRHTLKCRLGSVLAVINLALAGLSLCCH